MVLDKGVTWTPDVLKNLTIFVHISTLSLDMSVYGTELHTAKMSIN